jgi:ABC-type Fe3+/spermidine/putrescine transport system ATPase subunit
MSPTRVVLSEIRKTYGDARAVDGLSLAIPPGELFALVGPSGSGKSTVLRCLSGLERPDAGTVAFDGVVVNDVSPVDRHVSVVFQNYALYPHLTVYENIAFGLVARAYHRAGVLGKVGLLARRVRSAPLAPPKRMRIRDTIALVELAGLEERVPSELSGGQQQRVALARALVTEPRLLMMDEPLGALDARLRERVLQQLHAIHERLPVTTIYVTHDQAEAALLASRVGVLNRGRLEQAGPIDALRDAPDTLFVADFFGSPNLLRAKVRAEGHQWWAVPDGGPALPLEGDPGADSITVLLRADRLRLAPPGDANGSPAQVREAAVAADGVRYRVTAGSCPIEVHARGETAAHAPGARVSLIVPPGAVAVLE